MTLLLTLLACRNQPQESTDSPTTDTACSELVERYVDADQDGWGTGELVELCDGAPGYSEQAGDCDDSDPASFPGAWDQPLDGIDQDCDGADNRDGDGDGDPVDTDCDDSDPARSSLLFELCNTGVDEDCDGVVDEDCQYFGGVASGLPDVRVEGTWLDDWQNRSFAGQYVFALGDIDGGGSPDFAITANTYRGDTVHLFAGEDISEGVLLDLDDAFLHINGEFSPTEIVGIYENDSITGIVLNSTGRYHYLSIENDIDTTATVFADDARSGYGVYPISGDSSLFLDSQINAVSASGRWGTIAFFEPLLSDDPTQQHSFITFDTQLPYWGASEDWDGDGESELLVRTHSTESEKRSFYHLPAPIERGDYGPEIFTLIDEQTTLDTSNWMNFNPRPDLHGDLDNDGRPDVLAEATQGSLYVWGGVEDVDLQAPTLRIEQPASRPAGADGNHHLGDINCDGHLDLTQRVFVEGQDGELDMQVYLVLGPLGTGVLTPSASPDGTLTQLQDDGWFGYDHTFLGDLNGDGCQELLVGDADYSTDPDRYGPGAAHLFFGAPGMP